MIQVQRFSFLPLLLLCLYLGGCINESRPAQRPASQPSLTESARPEPSDDEANSKPSVDTPEPDFYFPNPSGNRLVIGKGVLPAATPLDIPLNAQPRWINAHATDNGSQWIVLLDNGDVQSFHVTAGTVTDESTLPFPLDNYAPITPLALQFDQGKASLFAPPADADPLTTATYLPTLKQWLYVATNGDLVIGADREVARFPVQALPDTRILIDEQARVLLLAQSSARYAHGILGDTLEPTAVVLIETRPTPRVITTIEVTAPQVIEGLSPLWADIDGDGQREIVVTISDATEGAREAVYDEAGNLLAVGQAIGQGFRWRHHVAVAPFAAADMPELVEVLTPHIGGIVQFSRLNQNDPAHAQLEVVAQYRGYTAHQIGTRNLDMAVAGDFDGDGRLELLLPDNAYQNLGAVQRTASEDGAELIWTVPIGAALTTNLATVTDAQGTMAVGVGRADNTLRLWLPR